LKKACGKRKDVIFFLLILKNLELIYSTILRTIAQWLLIVRYRDDFRLIFINTPFIDDLLSDPAIHTLVRGGITCGFVDSVNSGAKNEWGGVFTTFPFLSECEFLKSERDENYPKDREERLKIAAYQICHELTHLLLRYDDAYDHLNCILNPPKGLRYKKWYDGIVKSGKCPKKHKRYKQY
jgi:hypothetical protein